MSSLIYILITTLKNRIIELKKKPALLILYICAILFLGLMIIVAAFKSSPVDIDIKQDIFLLKGIIFAFVSFSFYFSIKTGISTGGSFFDMCDVNMLFVSPLNSKLILAYGLLRQAGSSLLISLFIFFQAQTLKVFGVGLKELMIIFFSYFLSVILFQTLSIFIYSITNGNKKRKIFVNAISIIFIGIVFGFIIFQLMSGSTFLKAVIDVMKMPTIDYIPFIGWVSSFIIDFITGETSKGLILLFVSLLSLIVMVLFVAYSKDDYYEDVLVATETVFEKKIALKEGNLSSATANNRKIKVQSTGIWGNGVHAIFGKHLRELQRSNYFAFLDASSTIYIFGGVIFSIFSKNPNSILMILAFSMYIQSILIGMGLGLKELYFHYIYLIPQSSFKKIIWSNMEIFMRTFIESTITFIIVGIIVKANPLLILLCILIRTIFSAFLVGLNFSSLRFFKGELNAGLVFVFYFLFILIVLFPGILFAIFIVVIIKNTILALISFLCWLTLVSFLFIFTSRKILHNCDIATIIKK